MGRGEGHDVVLRVASGALLANMSERLMQFVVPLLIFSRTESVSMLGVAFGLQWLPTIVAYPFSGVLADRVGGVPLFRWVTASRSALLLAVSVLCFFVPGGTVLIILAAVGLLSALQAPVKVSIEKVAPEAVPAERLARMQSLIQNMDLVAMALGPLVGLLVSLSVGRLAGILLAGVMSLVASLLWCVLPVGIRNIRAATVRVVVHDLISAWKILLSMRSVVMLVALNFCLNMIVGMIMSTSAGVVTGMFDGGDLSFGVINIAVGIAGFASLWLGPLLIQRAGVNVVGVIGFVLFFGAALAVGTSQSLVVYSVGYVVMIFGVSLYNVYNRTRRVETIPREHLGKVIGPFFVLNFLSFPIIAAIVGVGGDFGAQRLVLVLVGALVVPSILLMVATVRRFGGLRGRPALADGSVSGVFRPPPRRGRK